jgi:HTH-type transcriptional regulator/antitoxin HigA
MTHMIEPVVDSSSHQKALRRIERLWDAKPASRKERELDALATLVDAYERRVFPIEHLSPSEAIIARCEQLGWSRRELEPLIGSRARVSEVLTGRRQLTLPMIRGIHRAMNIPAEILISGPQPAQLTPRRRRASDSNRKVGPSVARAAQQRVAPDGRARVRSPARR